ncbi:MAG: hypothetical protein ACE5JX_09685 [Acidobacteriota bacterium]
MDTNRPMFHGHTWAITVPEADGTDTVSCTQCHSTIDTKESAYSVIDQWQSVFQIVDGCAGEKVAAAVSAMEDVDDPSLQAKLDEAQHNLNYAESDESGGFHNHYYSMVLLVDAYNKAEEILTALGR